MNKLDLIQALKDATDLTKARGRNGIRVLHWPESENGTTGQDQIEAVAVF